MKNLIRTAALSLILLSSIMISYGQKHVLDSVYVQINDNMELNLAIYEYPHLFENVEKDLKSLQSILKDNKIISGQASCTIDYEPDNLLSVKQTEPSEKIIWVNGKQIRYQFNNHCYIYSNQYKLKIKFNELEDLISDSLIIKLKQVIDTTSIIQNRSSKTYNYSFQGETLIRNKQLDGYNGQRDIISLKGGIGVNLIKNQAVIDLSAEMAFVFSKKGIQENQFYLTYNQLSDFSNNSKDNLNGFVDAGYRHNLSYSVKDPNWIGIEIGFLTGRQGDLFEKNTVKLGVNWEIGKYISISPQLYISNKSTYPAVRIGFGL